MQNMGKGWQTLENGNNLATTQPCTKRKFVSFYTSTLQKSCVAKGYVISNLLPRVKRSSQKSPSLCTSNCTSKYIHIYEFSKNEFCESRVQERRLLVTFWMRRLYLVHASRQSCIVVLKRILYFMSAYSRAMCKPNYNAHHTLLSVASLRCNHQHNFFAVLISPARGQS